jgi:hypothetical protein
VYAREAGTGAFVLERARHGVKEAGTRVFVSECGLHVQPCQGAAELRWVHLGLLHPGAAAPVRVALSFVGACACAIQITGLEIETERRLLAAGLHIGKGTFSTRHSCSGIAEIRRDPSSTCLSSATCWPSPPHTACSAHNQTEGHTLPHMTAHTMLVRSANHQATGASPNTMLAFGVQ